MAESQTRAGIFDRQRDHLFPWVPVALATGVGLYFASPSEPTLVHWTLLALSILICLVAWIGPARQWPLIIALGLVLLGTALAGLRAHSVAEPVLGFRYYGPIEGRIVGIDRSASDKVRLTLDQVVLERMDPARTPTRVRVSLHGQQGYIEPEPGLRVILTGHLSAPNGPVEPGGFDFQRQAWFQKLGGVGYTRTPVLAIAAAEEGRAGLLVHRARTAISTWVQAEMPGRTGAFAAAIMTGDRSGMDQETLESLRKSNLAHLLAISGLHMGLLTGFVFLAIRVGLAALPSLALRAPIKKIAAVGALLAGAGYLALSGGNVATERAFIMVGVMFGAVLFDRRALTLRAVAIAAIIVLILRPEVLVQPGFQMSFAATTALVAAFATYRDQAPVQRRWLIRSITALFLSSLVAGLATAPYAAAHFNRVPHYGLIANLLSVPLMGAVIVPGIVATALLAPLGLGWLPLRVIEPAIGWILGVADWVAGLSGSVSHVPAPPPIALPLLTLGALFVILWQGRIRWMGVAPMVAALGLWSVVERPAVLIAETGGLVGILTTDGRALSKPRGDGFAARSWLENDGDGALQQEAAERGIFVGDKTLRFADLGPLRLAHATGRGAVDAARAECRRDVLLVVAARETGLTGCEVIDQSTLSESGALAVYLTEAGLRFVPTRQGSGRLWSR